MGCTHVAHAEISAEIAENGHFGTQTQNPQMCLMGADNAPQNREKNKGLSRDLGPKKF